MLGTSAAKAGFFSSFTAGLRSNKPKSGLPGATKGLFHPVNSSKPEEYPYSPANPCFQINPVPQRLKPMSLSALPQA
jgi:hypothetical protein